MDRFTILKKILRICYLKNNPINIFHHIILIADNFSYLNKIENKYAVYLVCTMIIQKVYGYDNISPIGIRKLIDEKMSLTEIVILEEDILNFFNFDLNQNTLLDKISSNTCKYLATMIIFDDNYLKFNLNLLAKNIDEFIQSINNIDIENNIHLFIFTAWKNFNKLRYLNKYFPNEFYFFHPLQLIKCNKKFVIESDYLFDNTKGCLFRYSMDLIENSIRVRDIGKGSFGKVYHYIIDNNDVAIKYNKEYIVGNGVDVFILREMNILQQLNHPSIIKIKGFFYDRENYIFGFGMELMQNTLRSRIIVSKNNYTIAMKYIIQLLEGVDYLHDNNIIHRDLSTTNIMIDNNDNLRIIDFGQSKFVHWQTNDIPLSRYVCSLFTRAIELILGKKTYDFKIDVWSCACIIGYILSGEHMFSGRDENNSIELIFSALGTPTEEEITSLPNYPKNVRDYPRLGLRKLQTKYPKHTEILYKMLEYSPQKRIDIKTALKYFREI